MDDGACRRLPAQLGGPRLDGAKQHVGGEPEGAMLDPLPGFLHLPAPGMEWEMQLVQHDAYTQIGSPAPQVQQTRRQPRHKPTPAVAKYVVLNQHRVVIR